MGWPIALVSPEIRQQMGRSSIGYLFQQQLELILSEYYKIQYVSDKGGAVECFQFGGDTIFFRLVSPSHLQRRYFASLVVSLSVRIYFPPATCLVGLPHQGCLVPMSIPPADYISVTSRGCHLVRWAHSRYNSSEPTALSLRHLGYAKLTELQ